MKCCADIDKFIIDQIQTCQLAIPPARFNENKINLHVFTVSAKHKETKQYYTLYNTLEDTRLYMQKELSLLNSISENYPEAMKTSGGKEEFITQFQNILESVRQSKIKVEQKSSEVKQERDNLCLSLQTLIEQQRKYVTAIRQLSIEYRKHEALLSQKRNKF